MLIEGEETGNSPANIFIGQTQQTDVINLPNQMENKNPAIFIKDLPQHYQQHPQQPPLPQRSEFEDNKN